MARKKVEPITSLGKNIDKLTVQKSLPLFSLWQSELTLAEFKILDIYLSRINSHNPEQRQVTFEKGEIENILEVKKINNVNLKERLKHLMGSIIELPDPDSDEDFTLVNLFEEAVAKKDNLGYWKISLECTQKAMKFFFNIEELGYLRYKLRCVTSLKSRYSYIMFIYLEHNRFRKSWEVKVDELKQILHCETEETYKEYKRFNDLILKRIHNELHEKTECRYSYEPIKKGRSVVAIRFTVETLPKLTLEDINVDTNIIEVEKYDEDRDLWEEAVEEFNFTKEQINELREVLYLIPEEELPKDPQASYIIEISRYTYMQLKVAEIKRIDKETPIKNKYKYLLKIIKNDADLYF